MNGVQITLSPPQSGKVFELEASWTMSPQSYAHPAYGSMRGWFKRGSRGYRRHVRRLKGVRK